MAYSKTFEAGTELVPTIGIYTIEGAPKDYALEDEIPRVLQETFGEGYTVRVVEDIDTDYNPNNVTNNSGSYSFDYHITVTTPEGTKHTFTLSLVGKTIELTTEEEEVDEEIIGMLEEGIEALIEDIDDFEKSGASMEEINAAAAAKNGASEGGRRRRKRGGARRKTRKAKAGRKTRKRGHRGRKTTHKRRGGSRRR